MNVQLVNQEQIDKARAAMDGRERVNIFGVDYVIREMRIEIGHGPFQGRDSAEIELVPILPRLDVVSKGR